MMPALLLNAVKCTVHGRPHRILRICAGSILRASPVPVVNGTKSASKPKKGVDVLDEAISGTAGGEILHRKRNGGRQAD
jgi:hypothetical protein